MTLPSASTLALFIPTFFFVSITPGMCMTLALTLGLRFGLLKTLWMMLGELVGVGLVVVLSAVGVATLLLANPWLFDGLRYGGGIYLAYLGYQMWHSKGSLALSDNSSETLNFSRRSLIIQGFTTAIANPKGWAFFIALLPPFLDPNKALLGQLGIFTLLILSLEFCSLLLYASGGKALAHYLRDPRHQSNLNRASGTLLAGVGLWLMLG